SYLYNNITSKDLETRTKSWTKSLHASFCLPIQDSKGLWIE
ncbi:5289_t:CDS:2, partial [Racocetra fulgida]